MRTVSDTPVCTLRDSCAGRIHGTARLNDRNNVIPVFEDEMFLLVVEGGTEYISLVLRRTEIDFFVSRM